MALSQRFSDVTCDVVHTSSLKVEQSYPIVKAERVKIGYGETVLLSIRDPLNLSVRDLSPALLKVFLPKRYAAVFTDADISSINDEQIHWNLIYRGLCDKTIIHILAIDKLCFYFQMSIIRPKMEQAVVRMQIETLRAVFKGWDLDMKFEIIASAPWAEPLGLCGLTPEKEYPVMKL